MKNLSFLAAFMLIHLAAFAQPNLTPQASFTSKTRVCSNVEFTLHSTTLNGDAYEWFVDGNHYSYSADTVLTLSTVCNNTVELKLVATNDISGYTDTAIKNIFVTGGSCGMHLYVDYEACLGDTVTYFGHPDAVLNQWTFSSPQTVVGGCITCDHISFVLTSQHPTLVNEQTFDGGCSDIIEYTAYFCQNGVSVNDTRTQSDAYIAPNPMKDKSVLHFNNTGDRKHQLSLYNMEGKLVSKTDNITGNEVTIERKDMPAGIYFYQLMSEDGKSLTGKVVIE